MRVVLAPGLEDALLDQARAAYPRECCGLLEGRRDGLVWQIVALHPARNLATAQDRFQIDPADHMAAQKAARARGQGIVGCYHSHPNGQAVPSVHDLAGAGEEEFLWLIAAGEGVAAFVYAAGAFAALALSRD